MILNRVLAAPGDDDDVLDADATASSTPYWMIGLSTRGSISFGCALVAGRNRVPRPRAGKDDFATRLISRRHSTLGAGGGRWRAVAYNFTMLDPLTYAITRKKSSAGCRTAAGTLETELEQLSTLENRRRRLIPELEGLKRDQNAAGDEVARAKRQGKDASGIFEANRQRAQQIRQLSIELDQVEQQRSIILMSLPNLPHASVPVGKSEADNVVVRTWGEPTKFEFEPQAHWDLGPALGILDFERATKMSGARFALLLGAGARLSRALTDFMLDLHTASTVPGVGAPYLVNRASLEATDNCRNSKPTSSRFAGEWDLFLIPRLKYR
jgi:seryl-tRNA synthetase